MALGVLLDVAAGQLPEGAFAALGAFLGGGVFAPGDFEHHLGGEHTGVGKPDGVGVAQAMPCRRLLFVHGPLGRPKAPTKKKASFTSRAV